MLKQPSEPETGRRFNGRVIVGVTLLLAVAALAGYANRKSLFPPPAPPPLLVDQLDLNTGVVTKGVGDPNTIIVNLYSCGECTDGKMFGVATKLNDDAKEAKAEAEKINGPSAADARVEAGTMVAAYAKGKANAELKWVSQQSVEGAAILESVKTRCGNGGYKSCSATEPAG